MQNQKTQGSKIGQIPSEVRRGQSSYTSIKEQPNQLFDLTVWGIGIRSPHSHSFHD